MFFCKYNDPIYVKMEKLEIMIKLASDRNIDQVLPSISCEAHRNVDRAHSLISRVKLMELELEHDIA